MSYRNCKRCRVHVVPRNVPELALEAFMASEAEQTESMVRARQIALEVYAERVGARVLGMCWECARASIREALTALVARALLSPTPRSEAA